MIKRILSMTVAAVSVALSASLARAGSHLWEINEVFSNADGTVQFIEMHVPCGGMGCACNCETGLNGRWVLSMQTGSQFTFTQNLPPGSTAFGYLLLGTQAYADLPGAPPPDHIIPANFIDLDADTLQYWFYVGGDMIFETGELPLDGITSLHRMGNPNTNGPGPNSPRNFAGQTGSIDANACDDDVDCDDVDPCTLNRCISGGRCAFVPVVYGDVNDDATVDLLDILCVLDGFGGAFGLCDLSDVDIFPCSPDGVVDLQDILGVLDGFVGIQSCTCS